MADVADTSDEHYAPKFEADVAFIQQAAANIPKGEPGICDLCGEDMPRLVRGVCAPCRDKHKLP
jgi:RNA polymerase-binding transcription factor DksA